MKTQTRRRFFSFTRKDLFELCICILLSGLFVLLSSGKAFSQGNVGINNPMPHAKSLLDLTSSDKGLLTPRMTVAQRTAMFVAPDASAKGMLVYQTDAVVGFYYYDGAAWQMLQAGGAGWGLLGNAGTNATSNFLGTTDNVSVAFRTNNLERMRLEASGNVGINNTAPASRLQVTRNSAGYAPNVDAVITAENNGPAYLNVLSGNNETGLLFGSAANPQNGGIIYNGGSVTNGMQFRTGGNVGRLYITGAGDVTVGDGAYWPGYKFGVVANQPSAMSVYHNTNANGYSGIHFINNASTARAHVGAGNATSPNWANMGYAGTYTAHPFVLTTNDLERVRIDAAGNVGIGTTAPARLLEVSSPTQGVQRISSGNSTGGSVLELSNATAGNNNLGAINFLEGNIALAQLACHKTDGMIFRTGGPERMRIEVGGNVGIGTSAPGSKLHVSKASSGIAPNANAVATMEGAGHTYQHFLTNTGESGLLFGSAGTSVTGGFLHNTGFAPAGIEIRTGGNTQRMTMTSNGHTTFGDATHWPAMRLGAVNNHATNPAVGSLNTNVSGWSGYSASRSDFGGGMYMGFGNASHVTLANVGFTGTGTNHPYAFLTNNTERMRIDANGNVGIGTTAPTSALEVNGFTKHGSNAPAIKQVEFTGTTAAAEGAFVDVVHGLTSSKIIDVRVLIEYTAGNWITTGYTINPEFLADYVIGATNIRLYNHNGSSGSILSKPVKILVTYKA